MAAWLETFGRNSLDTRSSGIDASTLADRLWLFRDYADSDPEGFLTELRAVVAGDRGGFATFGAARLVWEMYGGGAPRIPAASPLIDAGIEFVLSRDLPTAMLTRFEMKRLIQIREQGG